MKKNTRCDRILVVDDNQEIHADIKKILQKPQVSPELDSLFADIIGQALPAKEQQGKEQAELIIDSAFQSEEAVALVRQARLERRPYAMAYIDMRMPPGLDGLHTLRRLQQEDHQLHFVVITAYADYSWQEISSAMLSADKLLILKKPFEAIEIRQSASALLEKWHLTLEHRQAMSALVMQRNMLEEHVREQTAELRHTNELLTKEIKERRRAEEKIRQHRDSLEKQIELRSAEIMQQNRFLNTVINALPHPFAVIDVASHRILAANRAAGSRAAGRDHLRTCYQFMHGLSRPCHERDMECPLQTVRQHGKPVVLEQTMNGPDGSKQVMEIHACPVLERDGRITRVIEYCVDITRRKKMEQELIRNRKMEAISTMAGGIAHDFNNLLMAITGNIELSLLKLHPEHSVLPFLKNAAFSAEEAKHLAHKFLLFSHFAPPARRPVPLAELIAAAARAALDGSGSTAELHLPDNLWLLYADPGQIEQLLQELLKNAREAMAPAGGTVRISAENVCLLGHEASGRSQGRYVRIAVSDKGCGIKKEDLPKIFDPYFSGKSRGSVKGMGLGLTIAAFIVSQHEGHLEAEAGPGGVGATVLVDIPAAEANGNS
jgi:signal transduction histidine kinase/DNA-binding response OmpR family regulator